MSKPKSKAAGLRIVENELVDVASIQEAPYNPNVMTEAEQARLEASLREHGLVNDLIIQRKSKAHGALVLIGGHWRLRTMRKICAADGVEMPAQLGCKVIDCTDRVAIKLNLALNRVHGTDDPMLLGLLLSTAQFDDMELWSVNLAREQEAALVALARTTDEQAAALEAEAAGLRDFAKSVTLTVEFATVAERDQVKGALLARAKSSNAKAGSVLAQLLSATPTR